MNQHIVIGQWSRRSIALFVILIATIVIHSTAVAQSTSSYSYTVQPGDTWSRVAQLTGVPVEILQDENEGAARRTSGLRQGELLTIPVRPLSQPRTHVVEQGESWSSVAAEYGVPIKLMQAVNSRGRIAGDTLLLGTTLLVPEPSAFSWVTASWPFMENPSAVDDMIDSQPITVTESASISVGAMVRSNMLISDTLMTTSTMMATACQERARYIQQDQRVGNLRQPKVLKITDLEVTQSVPPENGQYIVDRSTAVLASIEPPSLLDEPHSVTGCLHLFADGVYSETIPAVAPVSIQDESAILVFESLVLPYIDNVYFDLEIVDVNDPLGTVYDVDGVGNKRFILDSVEPIFYYVPVQFGARPVPEPNLIEPGSGDALLKAVLPVSDQQDWRYESASAQLPYTVNDADGDGQFDCEATGEGLDLDAQLHDLRTSLAQSYQRNSATAGPISVTIDSMVHIAVYGWIADPNNLDGTTCVGKSTPNGTAVGTTRLAVGQRVYAHEIYHILSGDTGHSGQEINSRGWDVGFRLPGHWTLMDLIQEKPIQSTRSLMGDLKDGLTAKTWIRSKDYERATDFVCAADLVELTQSYPVCRAGINIGGDACIAQSVYHTRGAFTRSGVQLLDEFTRTSRSSVYSQPSYTSINQRDRNLPFAMLFYREETLLAEVPFDAEMHIDGDAPEIIAETPQYGLFSLAIEASLWEQADRILVRNINGDLLPYLERSATEPTIEITTPSTINNDDGSTTAPILGSVITVDIEDPDESAASGLNCHFSYSPDDGASWVPLQVSPIADESTIAARITVPCQNDSGNSYFIANEQILPTIRSRGILRAFVSDGYYAQFTDLILRREPIIL